MKKNTTFFTLCGIVIAAILSSCSISNAYQGRFSDGIYTSASSSDNASIDIPGVPEDLLRQTVNLKQYDFSKKSTQYIDTQDTLILVDQPFSAMGYERYRTVGRNGHKIYVAQEPWTYGYGYGAWYRGYYPYNWWGPYAYCDPWYYPYGPWNHWDPWFYRPYGPWGPYGPYGPYWPWDPWYYRPWHHHHHWGPGPVIVVDKTYHLNRTNRAAAHGTYTSESHHGNTVRSGYTSSGNVHRSSGGSTYSTSHGSISSSSYRSPSTHTGNTVNSSSTSRNTVYYRRDNNSSSSYRNSSSGYNSSSSSWSGSHSSGFSGGGHSGGGSPSYNHSGSRIDR